MGKFLNHVAKFAGETVRMKRTEKEAQKIDPQTKQKLDNLIAKAEDGDVKAMDTLATFYYQGKYVGYNPTEACRWWTEAATKGHVDAQYNLGLFYMGNLSTYVATDENKAGYWLDMAARNGDKEAADLLHRRFKIGFTGKWKLKN